MLGLTGKNTAIWETDWLLWSGSGERHDFRLIEKRVEKRKFRCVRVLFRKSCLRFADADDAAADAMKMLCVYIYAEVRRDWLS